jgi:hypothetical protein
MRKITASEVTIVFCWIAVQRFAGWLRELKLKFTQQ